MVKNSLSTQGQSFPAFIKSDGVMRSLSKTLGSETKKSKFVSSVISAVQTNSALQNCDFNSIINCALLGSSLDLAHSPQLGQYYMVPYGTNAQFILGYKGYVQLAERSGRYKKINVVSIKEGELVKFDPLNEEIEVNLIEDEEIRENAQTIGYYAMFEYHDGFRKCIYWSRTKMEKHAKKYSKSYNSSNSIWKENFDVMAEKTMLRQLISKWGYMSIDLQTAFENDMAIIKSDGTKEYTDNPKTESDFIFNQEIKEPIKEVIQEVNEPKQEVVKEQPTLL